MGSGGRWGDEKGRPQAGGALLTLRLSHSRGCWLLVWEWWCCRQLVGSMCGVSSVLADCLCSLFVFPCSCLVFLGCLRSSLSFRCPFKCNYPGCTKTFRWKSSLTFHEGLHLAPKNQVADAAAAAAAAAAAMPQPAPVDVAAAAAVLANKSGSHATRISARNTAAGSVGGGVGATTLPAGVGGPVGIPGGGVGSAGVAGTAPSGGLGSSLVQAALLAPVGGGPGGPPQPLPTAHEVGYGVQQPPAKKAKVGGGGAGGAASGDQPSAHGGLF